MGEILKRAGANSRFSPHFEFEKSEMDVAGETTRNTCYRRFPLLTLSSTRDGEKERERGEETRGEGVSISGFPLLLRFLGSFVGWIA